MNTYELIFSVLNTIITAVTAFATIRYVRISSKTLREIKLQRETTYLPEIIINSITFNLRCDKKYGFPIEYTIESKVSDTLINELITFFAIPIRLYNIGLGAAKDVHYNFQFDINKATAILQDKKVYLNNDFEHEFTFDYKQDSILINGINGMSYFSISLDEKFNSYLLPVNIENSGTDLNLPLHISTLYAIYTFIWRMNHKLMENCSFPPIIINISYSDINNNIFNKTFEVNLLYKGGGATEIWNKLEVEERKFIF